MPRAQGSRPAVRALSPGQVARAVERMGASAGTDRYAAGKALIVTAGRHPARVYPEIERLAALLGSGSTIIRWNAQRLLALLAPADDKRKLAALLPEYLGAIQGSHMISAANAIVGAGKIAQARPELLPQIVPAILQVEGATYETPECRNVAIGHALDVFGSLWPAVRGDPAVRAFVERQTRNPRKSAARRAQALLR